MIFMWPKHKPGQRQYCYIYQLNHPDLRGGFYVQDFCRKGVTDGDRHL